MFIITLSTTLLQILWEFMLCFKFIFKNMTGPRARREGLPGAGKKISWQVKVPGHLPCKACTHGNHFNPPGDIPEQLAAYSAHALSTALLMLGSHFSAGWTGAIWNKLSCPRTDQSAPAGNRTSNPLITSPTPNQLSYFVDV